MGFFSSTAKRVAKATRHDTAEEEIKKLVNVHLNSSKQSAEISFAHNCMSQHNNKKHLLGFPVKVRSLIVHYAVADRKDDTTVTASNPAQCQEPEIMVVCRDIRQLALPLFYQENRFVVRVQQYEIRAALPWLKRHEHWNSQKDDTDQQVAKQWEPYTVAETDDQDYQMEMLEWHQVWDVFRAEQDAFLPPPEQTGSIIIRTDGQPHWDNLAKWLQLARDGEVVALADDDYDGGDGDAAVKGAFKVVMGLKIYVWNTALRILPGVRDMLAVGDARWSEERNDDKISANAVRSLDERARLQESAEAQHAAELQKDEEMRAGTEEDSPQLTQNTHYYESAESQLKEEERRVNDGGVILIEDSTEDSEDLEERKANVEEWMDGVQEDGRSVELGDERMGEDDEGMEEESIDVPTIAHAGFNATMASL